MDDTILLPANAPPFTQQVLIYGENATLLGVGAFAGPFFDSFDQVTSVSKYTFYNLNMMNERVNRYTSHAFSRLLFRTRTDRCNFIGMKGVFWHDTLTTSLHFQSIWMTNCLFYNCDSIVRAGKVFDLRWINNYGQHCVDGIWIVPTDAGAGLISGSITGGAMEGFSGTAIRVKGPANLNIGGNFYMESNGDTTTPYIDLSDVLIGNAITIDGFNCQPTSAQNADPAYYPIALLDQHCCVSVKNCWTTAPQLVNPRTADFGHNWEIGPNYIQAGRPNADVKHSSLGKINIRRTGRERITGTAGQRIVFQNHSSLLEVSEGWVGKLFYCHVVVTFVNDASATDSMSVELKGLFRHTTAGGMVEIEQATKTTLPAAGVGTWDANLVVETKAISCTFSGTQITATGHGLTVNVDAVHFSTDGTLPSPLIPNSSWVVINVIDPNTFEVGRSRFGPAVSFTGGSGNHTVHVDDIDVIVNGRAATTDEAFAEATIDVVSEVQ